MKTILTNCTVIDCTGKPPKEDVTVVIQGDKIAGLKPGAYGQSAGEGERVFDLEGGYVLPGLWNCHAHLGYLMPDTRQLEAGESVVDRTIRAGRNCIEALRVGVTSIRVVGESDFIDVAWKRAFHAGVFVGPRVFASGEGITATGGHGSDRPSSGLRPVKEDDSALLAGEPTAWRRVPGGPSAIEIDGPYEMRKAVRENLKHGVDHIKLLSTDALVISPPEGRILEYELMPDEVKAATEVAHQKGVRVCADAGGASVNMAIRCGVDCIEHGCDLDDEAIDLMVENDVFYDPTLSRTQEGELMLESGMATEDESAAQAAREEFLRARGTAEMDAGHANRVLEGRLLIARAEGLIHERAKSHLEGFRKALKAGVKITCGSDSSPIGETTLLEIEHLVRAGMGEMDALIAATRTSADLCGAADRLGTVEEGKLADLIVLSADPLENISNIRKLKLVLKGGKLVETKESEGLADFWELFYFG